MRRGRPPKPTALKVLTGNPGKRPLNHEEPDPTALTLDDPRSKPPKWMAPIAREFWKRAAPEMIEAGVLTVMDLAAFEMLCQTYARWREAERLTGENFELAIAKGYRTAAVKERQLLAQLGGRFGFDPSSRSSVKLPKKKPVNKVDEFKNRNMAIVPPRGK